MRRVFHYTAFIIFLGSLFMFFFHHKEDATHHLIKIGLKKSENDRYKKEDNEIAEAPQHVALMQSLLEPNKNKDQYVSESNIEGNPLITGVNYYNTVDHDIVENLLTGEDLWRFKPNLLDTVKKEQGISMLPIGSIIEIDNKLLTNLKIGDSLLFLMPNGAKQQIVISHINYINDNVTSWDLQNSQHINIGKITKIGKLTEGSFITDSKNEFHLRILNNRGWLTTKEQLIRNNEEAVKRTSENYTDLIE